VPEAATVGRLIDGLGDVYPADGDLLEQGIVVFEALYRAYASEPHAAAAKRQPARRAGRRKKGR
jgi:hypothetical protein